MNSSNFLVLDTETTGLGENDEIVEICLIDSSGNVVYESLVKPSKKIPGGATEIHGITNEMVENAPKWYDVLKELYIVLDDNYDKKIAIYNAEYDIRLVRQSSSIAKKSLMISASANNNLDELKLFLEMSISVDELLFNSSACVMKMYQKFNGIDKRQKLSSAAKSYGIHHEQTHRAAGDCITTLAVINSIRIRRNESIVIKIITFTLFYIIFFMLVDW